ncbi:hypothetical protein CCACVL1_18023 [Corchorus capsularis]|uniref:Uncharacterized protein n=1 Tax=Corchorus capsularis TaxID=210143 RepID=A0A1R3HNM1_COCAP|nr:hypothetical protein CCACVL1_18023 [Corchorus capsularis]
MAASEWMELKDPAAAAYFRKGQISKVQRSI